MAKKTKKSKGRESKPRGTVSWKHEPTPYNRARGALKVKMIEDRYLLVNHFPMETVPMETVLETFVFVQSLETNIALQRQKLRHQPRRKDTCYKHHLRVLLYKKVNLKKIHHNNTSATIETMKQNQDDQRLAAQVVLSKRRLEFCVSNPEDLEHSECSQKIMDAKIPKDVPAQMLKIEKPTKVEERIEEVVRRMERELDEEFREFDTNRFVVDSLIKAAEATQAAATTKLDKEFGEFDTNGIVIDSLIEAAEATTSTTNEEVDAAAAAASATEQPQQQRIESAGCESN